jgi:hypothetical protein
MIDGKQHLLIPIEQAEQDYDIKESVLATVLSYVESDNARPICVHQSGYLTLCPL